MTPQGATAYAPLIASSAHRYRVPADILDSLLYVESGFNPAAFHRNTNGSVDRGIAQINSAAHPHVTAQQADNPAFAIPYAAQILASNRQRCGSWSGALQAYNSGSCTGAPGYAARVLGQSTRISWTRVAVLIGGAALFLVVLEAIT